MALEGTQLHRVSHGMVSQILGGSLVWVLVENAQRLQDVFLLDDCVVGFRSGAACDKCPGQVAFVEFSKRHEFD